MYPMSSPPSTQNDIAAPFWTRCSPKYLTEATCASKKDLRQVHYRKRKRAMSDRTFVTADDTSVFVRELDRRYPLICAGKACGSTTRAETPTWTVSPVVPW